MKSARFLLLWTSVLAVAILAQDKPGQHPYSGTDIPDDQEIDVDLTGPDYFFSPKGQIQLEPKDAMKARGLDSPDIGDCLAYRTASRSQRASLLRSRYTRIRAFRILRWMH